MPSSCEHSNEAYVSNRRGIYRPRLEIYRIFKKELATQGTDGDDTRRRT